MSTLADLDRSKAALITENNFLRQQLIALERQVANALLVIRCWGACIMTTKEWPDDPRISG